ncbi:MAG: helix-turn-helix domain-containing protein [Bacteroidales bacterium]|nr:helix-turn-helix domain-containing protein [Bacteroidales bacterium]
MENITFEQLPLAISRLIDMVGQLSAKVDEMIGASTTQQGEQRRILNLYDLSALLGKAPTTIYAMTSEKRIPFYKKGNKLYFFEDEIIRWIEEGESGALYKGSDFDKRLEELRSQKTRKPASLLADNAHR